MELSQHMRAILSFVQVADTGSFAAAARVLNISTAAVSKNVAGLEQALGVRLMNRTTRTLSLTGEGTAFLKQARIALDALSSAMDSIAVQRGETAGRVRISTSAAFGHDFLLPALVGLRSLHPALSVEADFDDRVVDLVGEGYDLAIRGGHIADSALVSRPICRMQLVLVASPQYLEKAGIPQSPDALKQHQLIVRRFPGGRTSAWNFRAADDSLTTLDIESPALTFTAPEALAQAARLGLGIAELAVHHVWHDLVAGKLKIVLLEVHDPGRYELVMQFPHRALMAPRVRATIDCLMTAFAASEALHVSASQLKTYGIESNYVE